MNKLILLGIAATLGAAKLAFLPANPPVELQPTSPGTAQTGHLNISGTATVGLLKSKGTVFGESTAPTGFAYGGFFTAASNQARGFYGFASSPTGLTYGGFFQNASESGRAVYGLATSTTGFNYGGYFQTASNAGRGLLGVAASPTGTTYGVYGTAVSPNGFGVYSDGNLHATGVISGNGSGLTNVPVPNPLSLGGTTNGFTITASNASTTVGTGAIYGASTAATGTTYAGFFTNSSPLGRGVFAQMTSLTGNTSAGWFRSDSDSGRGVTGLAYNSSGSGTGGYFQTNGTSGKGVWGFATSAAGTNYGVYGSVSSASGYGLYSDGNVGVNNGKVGIGLGLDLPTTKLQVRESSAATLGGIFVTNGIVTEVSPTPVRRGMIVQAAGTGLTISTNSYAESTNDMSYALRGTATGLIVNYGVFGQAFNGSTNYGGYFDNLYATSASSGVKAFMIDHPLDPANKILSHSSVESDERMNLYRGVTKTDAQGFAWIAVPGWFDALNTDIQYSLTVVGDESEDFVQVKVARKLRDGRFRIRTSAPGVEVNWLLTGVRHDPVSKHYPLQVERMKTEGERGKYYEPEAYGKDKSLGMGYVEETPAQTSQRTKRPPQKR